jgi:DNA-binding transcriptional ArsR family regulator
MLAAEADVSPSTASSHLHKLLDAGLLSVEAHGRNRFYRTGQPPGRATARPANPARARPADPLAAPGHPGHALRQARTCYDHLAERRADAEHDRNEATPPAATARSIPPPPGATSAPATAMTSTTTSATTDGHSSSRAEAVGSRCSPCSRAAASAVVRGRRTGRRPHCPPAPWWPRRGGEGNSAVTDAAKRRLVRRCGSPRCRSDLSSSSADSGVMVYFVPLLRLPKVCTAGSPGSIWRARCRRHQYQPHRLERPGGAGACRAGPNRAVLRRAA